MTLIYITNFYCFTNFKSALVGFFHSHHHTEKCGFSCAVRSDNTYNSVWRKHEIQIFEQKFFAESFRHTNGFNHFVSKSWPVGNKKFKFFLFFFLVFVHQSVVSFQTCFPFCVTRFGSHSNPLQLSLKCLTALAGLLFFHSHTRGFLLEPRRVISFPGNSFTAIKFQNPTSHIVEEVAVVGNGDYSSGILLKVMLKPFHRFGIEVVGGLIEQQNVGLAKQQTAQSHTATFTS